MIKPGKSPVFETPDKYGLAYDDVTFKTSDGVHFIRMVGKRWDQQGNHTIAFWGAMLSMWVHPRR